MEWSWLKWLLRVFKGCASSVFATIYKPVWKGMKVSITIPHHPSPSIIIHHHPSHTSQTHSENSIIPSWINFLSAETSCDIFRWLPVTWTPAIPPLLCCGDGCCFHLTTFESISNEAEWCRGVSWWIIYFWIIWKSASKNDYTFGKFHHEHPFLGVHL